MRQERETQTVIRADESMEAKLRQTGRIMSVGCGILIVCAICISVYHMFLNYTRSGYQGEYYDVLLPLFIVITAFAVINNAITDFLKRYAIVKK